MKNITYGLHAVLTLCDRTPEKVRQLWVQLGREDEKIKKLIAIAERTGIALHVVPAKTLDKLAEEGNHQGVIAELAQKRRHYTEDDLASILAEHDKPWLILILDGIEDPHNLGACLRSADAAGVACVIAPKDQAVGLTSTAVKVACGASETVPFIQVTNLARTLQWLKKEGVWLHGTAAEADMPIYQADLTGNVALILGAEDKGLRRLTREYCDYLVNIPMVGHVESLNVSVATGICLFEARRQRS